MKDAFAALGFPRHPWLDADEVRATFQRLAASAHPDRSGSTSDFSDLTAAYGILREPASRLRHFLALERSEPATGLPADLIEYFSRVAHALKHTTANPAQTETMLAELTALRDAALARIREIDRRWTSDDFAELARLLARLGFLDKWTTQLSEALLALKL